MRAKKAKVVLTPEQLDRLVGTMISDADRRRTPDPRQALPVSNEDMRSFRSNRVDSNGYATRD